MSSRIALLLLFSLLLNFLLFACNNRSQTNNENLQDQAANNVFVAPKVDLPLPNMEKIRAFQKESGISGDIYSYLLVNFDTVTPKEVLRKIDNMPCAFYQGFEPSFRYFQSTCQTGAERYSITLPTTDLSQIKAVIASLFYNEGFMFNSDTTAYTLQEDGSGCTFKYKEETRQIIVEIMCTD